MGSMSTDSPETDYSPQAFVYGKPLQIDQQGKCYTCGFFRLAVPTRNESELAYQEIRWETRYLGGFYPRIKIDSGASVQPNPGCLIGISYLQDEIGKVAHEVNSDFERAALKVIKEDRKCPKWQGYNPGKPIEQYYMEDFMQRLEELRQKFQKDGEERQRIFAEEQSRQTAELSQQTTRIIEALLVTNQNSAKVAENSLAVAIENKLIVEQMKAVSETSLAVVSKNTEITEQMKVSADVGDRFIRRMTWLVAILAILQVVLATLALTSDSLVIKLLKSKPPIIEQQPRQSEKE
jgi:hypothetical protein